MLGIEWINFQNEPVAVIIRSHENPDSTTFVTPDHLNQQGGFIVYPKGGTIAAHIHIPITRQITGTSETLIIREGKMLTKLYSQSKEFISSHTLTKGDIIMLFAGGHSFEMLEETVLFEVKQGPYTGLQEKERFE